MERQEGYRNRKTGFTQVGRQQYKCSRQQDQTSDRVTLPTQTCKSYRGRVIAVVTQKKSRVTEIGRQECYRDSKPGVLQR